MLTIYRCGCRADGDNVAATCPMHGEREITDDEAIDILTKWSIAWKLPAASSEGNTCRLSAAAIAWAFRKIRYLEGKVARMEKDASSSNHSI
jgi:hypothetical protein